MSYGGLLAGALIGVFRNYYIFSSVCEEFDIFDHLSFGMKKLALQISALTLESHFNGGLSASNFIGNCALLCLSHITFRGITHLVGRNDYLDLINREIIPEKSATYISNISALGAIIDGMGPIAVAALASLAIDKVMSH